MDRQGITVGRKSIVVDSLLSVSHSVVMGMCVVTFNPLRNDRNLKILARHFTLHRVYNVANTTTCTFVLLHIYMYTLMHEIW